jgi:predicted glycogen debranching enzyme
MDLKAEWLEADGLGGFASGTVSGIRTRRYHALLLTATTPPTGRVLLVNGFDAWVETPTGTVALSSHDYDPGMVHPDGATRIVSFEWDPWPRWVFGLEDGSRIEQELFVPKGAPALALSWRLIKSRSSRRTGTQATNRSTPEFRLSVRPLISGRDYYALHRENPAFRFEAEGPDGSDGHDVRLIWRPYSGLPGIVAASNGTYQHQPDWYRNFRYEQEQERGLDFIEDLASPGIFRWDLSQGEAVWLLASEPLLTLTPVAASFKKLRASEHARRQWASPLHRAADAYIVRRGSGKTIIAGYPWFTDWGRDTFISLRGLCLAGERLDEAREILLEWAGRVSEGMLPNRFPDHGEVPEYNSVDASLWYVIATHEFLAAETRARRKLTRHDQSRLQGAMEQILSGYAKGTRYGIRLDEDGLLAAGEPGIQVTWMDAKIGDYVVTPRIGKPVEVQALWLNALFIASESGSPSSDRWKTAYARGRESFRRRFWNEGGYLYDVVDCDHQPGTFDSKFRPNQIFAAGGLPVSLLEDKQARQVVRAVEAKLWTPMGLRSLATGEPGYQPYYRGALRERDEAYHQGTVWPWLIGPFVEAWVRAHGGTQTARTAARKRFLAPLLGHLNEAGLGHISEIADAEEPYTPRGCPFQAWSVGEALRLDRSVLAGRAPGGRTAAKKSKKS